ncbi:MAG: Hsp20/alpha crystallin family protein [Leptonema illini]|jgi:HSP20 family protein|uniref:Heat shock protein Hsp20 n=2 Tax=Leptonema illini TaxID=183 RepID=H2CCF9_9LEPT|nr:Hsp20/alpha crystallin family protein [Leptonema illini]EHQ07419.1 heat shock protein Hsp20 [Leptonema illini DSM 21528]KAB2933003.1 MAG: Hsp20/alpha crystallin family protein [Leptonema illini]
MWNTLFRDTLLDGLTDFYSSRADLIRHSYPGVRFHEKEEGLTMRAEVPGVHPENIDVQVKEDVLTLTIEKKSEVEGEEKTKALRHERRQGKFTRSFQLPFRVDADRVQAECRLGVLTVELPKAEVEKPKKIAVS